ncbi:rod shape-determining protein RodA [Halosquirtibacter xylanolyticus]|uniref:rod shape-determining protein RodA n=1 Tax=Halosquirtibacter xylanolyticus TaxID=3374599 RepID=UPI003747C0DD|nr:rod shape-determining protein RodA [Prolixibacteraceae bacterium]
MRQTNILSKLDWVTILLYIMLMLIGWVNIYAAVYNIDHDSMFDFSQRYGKQLMWIGASLILMAVVMLVDSQFFTTFAYYIYGAAILLLLVTLVSSTSVKGAKAWIKIGSFALQPAELAKFATNLALAKMISQYNFKVNSFNSYLKIGLIIGLPILIILLQNDTGSALVFFVFILVLYREGLPGIFLFIGFLLTSIFIVTLVYSGGVNLLIIGGLYAIIYCFFIKDYKHFVVFTIGLGLLYFIPTYMIEQMGYDISVGNIMLYGLMLYAAIFSIKTLLSRHISKALVYLSLLGALIFSSSVDYVFNDILQLHQRARIEELLGIRNDPLGVGYNVNQSKIAIGSGGITGKGFLNGTQTKFNFVPEQSTDFIFCTIGEEWGFMGSSLVVFLFIFLFLRLIYIAERQRSRFSRVYGYGVACILFFHFAVNIGMTIGLAPVIGIPLPFISYGGSSLWSFTILLSIFLKLDSDRMDVLW